MSVKRIDNPIAVVEGVYLVVEVGYAEGQLLFFKRFYFEIEPRPVYRFRRTVVGTDEQLKLVNKKLCKARLLLL